MHASDSVRNLRCAPYINVNYSTPVYIWAPHACRLELLFKSCLRVSLLSYLLASRANGTTLLSRLQEYVSKHD
jgi:hypothetical protein